MRGGGTGVGETPGRAGPATSSRARAGGAEGRLREPLTGVRKSEGPEPEFQTSVETPGARGRGRT